MLRSIFLAVFALFLSFSSFEPLHAQCPGCQPNTVLCQGTNGPCPNNMDTATVGSTYEDTLTFFLPEQVDASQQSGGVLGWVDFIEFEIVSIAGLPFGLQWSCGVSNCTYFPSQFPSGTFACVRFCGTPLAPPGVYPITITTIGTVDTPFGNQSGNEVFTVDLVVQPGSAGNNAFSYSPAFGCSPLAVYFQNNILSNGYQPGPNNLGFTYQWDFGNGQQSTQEQPDTVHYANGGNYVIQYQSVVDTLPFILQSLTVNSVNCTDIPFLNDWPDLYLLLTDGSGNLVLNTSNNTVSFDPGGNPHTWTINQALDNPPYQIEIMDQDGGIYGSDDNCFDNTTNPMPQPVTLGQATQYNTAVVQSFNQNGLDYSYQMQKTAFVTQVTDTLVVSNSPPDMTIGLNPSAVSCERDSIQLSLPPGYVYEWYQNDTALLVQSSNPVFYAKSSGSYKAKIIDSISGCINWTNDTLLTFHPTTPPGYPNVGISYANGLLSSNLSGTWTYQWIFFDNGQWTPIAPPLGSVATLSPGQDGDYALIATNSLGCGDTSNVITVTNSGLNQTNEYLVRLYPNPAQGSFNLELPEGADQHWKLSILDLSGRELWQGQAKTGTQLLRPELPAGTYLLKGHSVQGYWVKRFVWEP